MIRVFFGAERSDKGLAKIVWARANGIPCVYTFTNGPIVHGVERPAHYHGSKWMTQHYVVKLDVVGRPGWAGGHLLIRERDAELWLLRWGSIVE